MKVIECNRETPNGTGKKLTILTTFPIKLVFYQTPDSTKKKDDYVTKYETLCYGVPSSSAPPEMK